MLAVINNINQGVISVNGQGYIRYLNRKAAKLIGLALERDYRRIPWRDMASEPYHQVPAGKRDFVDEEVIYQDGEDRKNLLMTTKLIYKADEVVASVGTFDNLEDIQKTAFRSRGRQLKVSFADILGKSAGIEEVKRKGEHVASYDATVLITGESGTGKELLALAIHHKSKRAEYPFVAVNCSAIPENLLESELFGYEPGAFTGASKKGKPGKIEMAHKGTFFLDEIGDMSFLLQAKLLRFLQDKSLTRVGGVRAKQVDVVIAATNQNLVELVREKNLERICFSLNVIL